ncbi:MAG: ATP-dependent DNA helicase [Alphaproteobacteria bacterium]
MNESIENYETDPDIAPILKAIRGYIEPILVTGKAGTGKSTLVKFIRDSGLFPNTIVLAPTGIAAINISGQTIHSFFRLPPRIITPDALDGQRPNRMWKKVDLIIIDEISMVRADIIDGIDMVLRKARKTREPFGGARMMFVGDFHQLPPVVPAREGEILDRMGYKSPFAYGAHVLAGGRFHKFELTQVHRQSEDRFLRILSDIRQSDYPQDTLDDLNHLCHRPHREGVTPLLLTGTNSAAARYNAEGLAKIEGAGRVFTGKIEGKFNVAKNKLPVPETVELKVGARVMALKNDTDKEWVNGSLGMVEAITDREVRVRFDHSGKIGDVKISSWDNTRYDWDEAGQKPVSTVVGSYAQIPLTLAWAVTIHKAQGLTLDDVRIDLERGAFATGQTYVALSRARTLAGLSLARALTLRDVITENRHGAYI